MKKIFLLFTAFLTTVYVNAQRVELYKNGNLVKFYTEHEVDSIVLKNGNLLPGKFSVSDTKEVQFTQSNLYWDGDSYKFENTQIASSQGNYEKNNTDSYDANHVSHFFWTNSTDFESGNVSYMPYASNYSCSLQSSSDKFWCCEENPLTVNGTDKLYVLTGGDSGEWNYLIRERKNASNLCKYGVTVTDGTETAINCLIIAPDDYDYTNNTLKANYSLDEIDELGLVCLPAAGGRSGCYLDYSGTNAKYWSVKSNSSDPNVVNFLFFSAEGVDPTSTSVRSYGFSIRLVRTIEKVEKEHEFVDLGLSVKWATCNVGANTPEGYGDYFAWGETSQKDNYDWSTYKYCEGTKETMTKYCVDSAHGTVDNKSTLEPEDDAAHVNWGGDWRMPTYTETKELLDNCTSTWIELNGVYGYKLVSNVNGNSIFLPASGDMHETELMYLNGSGLYWTASLYTSNSCEDYSYVFDASGIGTKGSYRFWGRSVRAVCP